MSVLIVGASGATGKYLVEHLLVLKLKVKVIVRSTEKLPESWKSNNLVSIIQASVLDISESEMAAHLVDCTAVASCLGHNLSFKGIFGKPRRLVRDSVVLLCNAISLNQKAGTIKIVLMNTAGNRNRDLGESISSSQRIVVAIIRFLLPPHADNEEAADYLRTKIGQNNKFIEWVTVRPDNLVNENSVTPYELHQSPTRSAIFNAGTTSRTNVAHFMAQLIVKNDLWNKWKGQMPVIYNKASHKNKLNKLNDHSK